LVVYLGHIILPNGIMVHWAKVIVILDGWLDMEWRGSWSFQHTQGKGFKIPHSEKTSFQLGFHFTPLLECYWYWCYFWPTWWGRQGICYRLCILKQQGWKQLLFIRGGVFCCCMGCHTFQALFLWHQVHFTYRPPAYQMVGDQWQVY
jgi:hypothetical protein